MSKFIYHLEQLKRKPPEDVDAIMDVTETGTTLKQNKLKIVDEVLTSTAHLIVNTKSLSKIQRNAKKSLIL